MNAAQATTAAEDFNQAVTPGNRIRYREIKGEGPGKLYRTKTPATVTQPPNAYPVVFLHGKRGWVACDHCNPIADQRHAAIKAQAEAEDVAEEMVTEIHTLALRLEQADKEWRKASGYTGTAVHRPTYWWAMAKALKETDETAKPPATHLLASLKHSRTGEPLVAWWRPESRGYTTSLAQAGHFSHSEALAIEDGSTSTVAIPLTDLGHRLELSDDGDAYAFTGRNAALLELLLAHSVARRNPPKP